MLKKYLKIFFFKIQSNKIKFSKLLKLLFYKTLAKKICFPS